MYLKKLISLIFIALFIFVVPSFSQDNVALATKPEVSYSHTLYFVVMGSKITLEWKESEPPWEYQAWYPQIRKYYVLEDMDGDPTNRECMFTPPRTGHVFIQIRSTSEGTWVDGKDTILPDEPIGWYLFVEPAPVIGGGVD